jgi:hypothetical protein
LPHVMWLMSHNMWHTLTQVHVAYELVYKGPNESFLSSFSLSHLG